MIIGSPETIRARIDAFSSVRRRRVMVVTLAPDYPSRLRSYELLATEAMSEENAASRSISS